jgi:hypothetical protein
MIDILRNYPPDGSFQDIDNIVNEKLLNNISKESFNNIYTIAKVFTRYQINNIITFTQIVNNLPSTVNDIAVKYTKDDFMNIFESSFIKTQNTFSNLWLHQFPISRTSNNTSKIKTFFSSIE